MTLRRFSNLAWIESALAAALHRETFADAAISF